MHRKAILSVFLFITCLGMGFGQEEEAVLSSPEDWRAEILPFPLSFAPEIDLVGIEEIRFAPGWSDVSSEEFWAYSFVWYLEKKSAMTEKSLTEYFNLYYDGLMRAVAKEGSETKSDEIDESLCLFIETDEGFTGKMRVYDAFFTKNYITLNIKAKESYCQKTNRQIVLFDISPKSFDDPVWKIFDTIGIAVKCN